MSDHRIHHKGKFDEDAYWQRVDRNLGFLGKTDEEARANQLKLRDATIGIAGVGGIGGAVAMRLVRMGVGRLKLADPEDFEMSNIQRQSGARLDTIGRNKAEVVAEQTYELTRDCDIDVFTDGITEESAEEFVAGCDIVCDQIEFFVWGPRGALHRAARESEQCKVILSVGTAGHGALVHRYTDESPPVEETWGLPAGVSTQEEILDAFLDRLMPEGLIPDFPSRESVRDWIARNQAAPIWGATPAFCEGVLVDQICNEVIGFPKMRKIPPVPGYAWIDMFSWNAEMVEANGA